MKRSHVLPVSLEVKLFFFFFTDLKVFCIILNIGVENKACFSYMWFESSFNWPHKNLAFQSLSQHEINRLLKNKQKLFMGIYKPQSRCSK